MSEIRLIMQVENECLKVSTANGDYILFDGEKVIDTNLNKMLKLHTEMVRAAREFWHK